MSFYFIIYFPGVLLELKWQDRYREVWFTTTTQQRPESNQGTLMFLSILPGIHFMHDNVSKKCKIFLSIPEEELRLTLKSGPCVQLV